MSEREEFEKWLCGFVGQEPKNLDRFEYKLLTVREAWQEQQKKIDALKVDAENRQRACDDCSVRFSNEIDALKSLNPDVPCPACDRSGYISSHLGPVVCSFCNEKGTVPLTKAQEYQIKELEGQIKAMQESAQKRIETLGGEG